MEERFIKLKLVSIKNRSIYQDKYNLKIKNVKFLPFEFYTLLTVNNIIFNDIVLYTNKKIFTSNELESAIKEYDRMLSNHPTTFDTYTEMKEYIETNFDISIITAWRNTIDINSRDFKLMNLNDIIGNTTEIDVSDDMKKRIESYAISILFFTDIEDIKAIANKLYIWQVLHNMGFMSKFTLGEIIVTFDIKNYIRTINFFNLNDIK